LAASITVSAIQMNWTKI